MIVVMPRGYVSAAESRGDTSWVQWSQRVTWKLRTYHEVLRDIELSHDRNEAEKSEMDEEAKRKRIQRKKMGF
jgi:hypothetical protein